MSLSTGAGSNGSVYDMWDVESEATLRDSALVSFELDVIQPKVGSQHGALLSEMLHESYTVDCDVLLVHQKVRNMNLVLLVFRFLIQQRSNTRRFYLSLCAS